MYIDHIYNLFNELKMLTFTYNNVQRAFSKNNEQGCINKENLNLCR